MTSLQGTMTALVTPFRDGALDLPALEKIVAHQLAGGVDALVPCGTTGEAPTLHADEYRAVLECVVRLARGRVPVIGGAGSNSTAHALELVRLNESCGVDALLIVAPYYNKPSQEGLFRHFSEVARHTRLPIVVYNIPGRSGVEISVDTLKRLRDSFPNIAAVKHATGSVAGAADLMDVTDLPVLSGDDPITLPLMGLGAVGVVSVVSNLYPGAVKRLTQAALAGDWEKARAAHRALYSTAKAVLSLDTNPIPIKTAMAMQGFCAEEFRLPMCPLAPEKRRQLEALLAAAGGNQRLAG